MFRYVILFSMMCCVRAAALDAASARATQRKGRSIWPFTFSSPDASAESAIGREDALLLEQAGLEKSFNLSSHPLWKIHKYHGIDLKPVQIQTEIIKSKSIDAGGNRSTSLEFALQSAAAHADIATTSELPDLSFLDDLGGLADFLPDPEEGEASELIGSAIESEQSSQPGFFKRLWWRIWGSPESTSATDNSATAPSTLELLSSLFGFAHSHEDTTGKGAEGNEGDDSLAIYLPETQGSYMAVVLPSERTERTERTEKTEKPEKIKNPLAPQQNIAPPSHAAPPLFREAVRDVEHPQASAVPLNHASEYRGGSGVAALPTGANAVAKAVAKAVARWPASGSESQAWVQSWTPHAAYTVHVQGGSGPVQTEQPKSEPSSELEPPALVEPNNSSAELSSSWPRSQVLAQDVPPLLEAFQATRREQQASRKSSHSQDLALPDEGPRKEQQTLLATKPTEKASDGDGEKMTDSLSHFPIRIPEGLMRKLQVSQKDVDTILNDKESAARAAERLRSLQKEFEMRKEQLSYVYATRVKKQLD